MNEWSWRCVRRHGSVHNFFYTQSEICATLNCKRCASAGLQNTYHQWCLEVNTGRGREKEGSVFRVGCMEGLHGLMEGDAFAVKTPFKLSSPIHPFQDCLRQQKLPPDRLSGFFCPRGNGKFQPEGNQPCKGRIDSTHKIIHKAKKKAQVIVPPPAYVKPVPNPPKPKPVRTKSLFTHRYPYCGLTPSEPIMRSCVTTMILVL